MLNDCWLWAGQISPGGYGIIYNPQVHKYYMQAHRVVYEALVGQIPKGLYIDHLCRVRSCINPEHLEPVTNGENVLRGEGLTAQNIKKEFCIRGHPYKGENLYIYIDKKGRQGRHCRKCREISRIKYLNNHKGETQ